MAKIFIKGVFDPIEVSEKHASHLLNLLADLSVSGGKKDEPVVTDAGMFRLSQIKAIEKARVESDDGKKFREMSEAWNKRWREEVTRTPAEKASNLRSFFEIMWAAYTGEYHCPDEVWSEVESKAVDYFRVSTHRNLPDPSIWRGILEARGFVEPARDRNQVMYNVGSALRIHAMTVVERGVVEDIISARVNGLLPL